MSNTIDSSWREARLSNMPKGLWACFAEPEVRLNDTEIIGTIYVGFGTYMNRGGFIRSYVEIGRYCSIGRDVNIGLGVHGLENFSTSPFFAIPAPVGTTNLAAENPKRRVIIGHDVWIGDGVKIASGVIIGHGAVIAAGAVVTKDVPPYSIVGGVPGKHIKWRFEEDTRARLLATQWWDVEPGQLRELIDEDINASLERLETSDLNRIEPNYSRFLSKRSTEGQ